MYEFIIVTTVISLISGFIGGMWGYHYMSKRQREADIAELDRVAAVIQESNNQPTNEELDAELDSLDTKPKKRKSGKSRKDT